MNDTLNINVIIADRSYSLKIQRKDEERVRKAAKMVDKELAKCLERFKGNDLDKEGNLGIIAFQFAYEYLKLYESKGDGTFTQLLESMNSKLDDYLKSE